MGNDLKQAERMLRAAQSAVNRMRSCSRDQLERDAACYNVLFAQIVTIESAAHHMSGRMCADHPEIDWAGIAGITQRFLTHHIRDSRGDGQALPDYDRLWAVLNKDIPALISSLRLLISASSKEN